MDDKPEGYVFGRPTKYRTEFCQLLLEKMSEGWSLCEVCRELQICMDTLYRWDAKHHDFSVALKMGKVWAEAWFDASARKNLNNRSYQPILHEMMVRRRFRYAEDSAVELSELDSELPFVEQAKIVVTAMKKGQITPSQASKLMEVVNSSAKLKETTELEARLEELEKNV